MNNYFVTNKIGYKLKDLGFDEPCFKYIYTGDTGVNVDVIGEVLPSKSKNWNNDDLCVSLPLYSQVFRWFREKHNIEGLIEVDWDPENGVNGYIVTIVTPDVYSDMDLNIFKTYEEAEVLVVEKIIEIINQKLKNEND